MADKLSYQHAMVQICALSGWIEQAGREPDIIQQGGKMVVRTGPSLSISLQTDESDIHAHWNPLDGGKQVRARDQLLNKLKGMRLQPGSICVISPPMWKTD